MIRVAVYLRQSLDRDGEGLAVERQRKACQAFCEARGWTAVTEYVDNSVSASKGTRTSWRAMLDAIPSGSFDLVLAQQLDRLTRSMRDTEELISLCERTGVRVATVQGDLDLTTDSGRLVSRILSAVARGEVERKGDRQRSANLHRAAQGRPPVGPRALGWEKDGVTLVPHEAALIVEAFGSVVAGGSVRGVARGWNAAGLRTARGNEWRPRSTHAILTNPRYVGLRSLHGEIIGSGAWPAIVDPNTFAAVGGILADPGRRTSPNTRRKYLLSGLAACGVCGEHVNTGGTSHGVRIYKCSVSRHLARGAQQIDDLVSAVVVARLSAPDAAHLTSAPTADGAALRIEAQALRQRSDQLAESFAAGEITRAQLAAGSERLANLLADAERRVAALAEVDALGPLVAAADVEAAWQALDLDRRRSVVRALMDITLLSPGRGARNFAPETVEIAWKGDAG